METLILKGKPVSSKIKEELSEKISNLKSQDIIPSLAAIMVGNNPASKLYVSSKSKTFKKLDCYSKIFELASDINKNDLISFIQKLNKNKKFHGILLQLPLPNHLDEKEIFHYIECYPPFDKAGAYGIQDWSGIFVKEIMGCYDNVVGFPLSQFYQELKKLDINLLDTISESY